MKTRAVVPVLLALVLALLVGGARYVGALADWRSRGCTSVLMPLFHGSPGTFDTCQSAAEPAPVPSIASDPATTEPAPDPALAQQAQQEEQQRQQFSAGCQKLGGQVSAPDSFCTVDYPGWPAQVIPLDSDGTLNQGDAEAAKAQCADAKAGAEQDGATWADPPTYHPETGVCTAGTLK